jgi:hypothetical protein
VLYSASSAPEGDERAAVTIDEELNVLEDNFRRLKVEYDVFFGGGSKRPPNDLEWRVQSLMKKHGDGTKLSFAQRFRYNAMAQKYAIFSDLWRQKMKVKEEGFRRPQDKMLGIQGLRVQSSKSEISTEEMVVQPVTLRCNGTIPEGDRVRELYDAMVHARTAAGDSAPAGSFESFSNFVKKKTEQLRKDMQCEEVEYSVELEHGKVKLKAKAV